VAKAHGVILLCLLLLAQTPAAGSCGAGGGRPAEPRAYDYKLPPGFLAAITPDRISSVIGTLQSFGTRFAYSERANDAADYIASELAALNLTVRRQDFFYNGFTLTNVLAVLPGRNASLPALVLAPITIP
jgi:hypothetical protein